MHPYIYFLTCLLAYFFYLFIYSSIPLLITTHHSPLIPSNLDTAHVDSRHPSGSGGQSNGSQGGGGGGRGDKNTCNVA